MQKPSQDRERQLRGIVAHVADVGGSAGVADLQGWVSREYRITYRQTANLMETLYIRNWVRRFFGEIRITAAGAELVPRLEGFE
jgi:hypothetical protein